MQFNDLIDSDESNFYSLAHFPAVKMLVFVVFGIAINLYIKLTFYPILILILIYYSILFIYRNKFLTSKIFTGAVLIGFCVSLDINSFDLNIPDKTIPDMPAVLTGEITQVITLKDNRARIIISGSIDTKQLNELKNTDVILDIYKLDKSKLDIKTGYEIYAPVKARFPKPKVFDDEFDEAFYAKFNEVKMFATATAKDVKITERKTTIRGFFEPIVNSINSRIDQIFPASSVGIIKALITGDKSGLSQELKQAYSFTGTAHVLAVSGLHVGIISAMLSLFLGFFENRKVKFIIFTVLIIVYIFITGVQPSVIRAGFMSACIYYVYVLERRIKAVNVLSFVVLFLIIFDPMIIYSPGFQMSVASVYGILLCYLPFQKALMRLIGKSSAFQRYLASSLAVTFSASVVVTPIVAYYFSVYSIISPLTNLIIVPLTSLAMIYAFIALLLSVIYMPLGIFFAFSADFLIELSNKITLFAMNLPYSYIKTDNALILSILLSIIILYIFMAKHFNTLLFRTSVSALIFILIWFNLPDKTIARTRIIPYKDCVLLKHNIDTTASFYWIADRKPKNYSAADYSIYNHLKNSDKKLFIAIDGNIGLATVDKLKKDKQFKVFEVNIQSQKLLENLFSIKKPISQIIKEEDIWH